MLLSSDLLIPSHSCYFFYSRAPDKPRQLQASQALPDTQGKRWSGPPPVWHLPNYATTHQSK